MERDERIFIPKPRGRLPWRYQQDLLTQKQQWRLVSAGLFVLSMICLGAWAVLK